MNIECLLCQNVKGILGASLKIIPFFFIDFAISQFLSCHLGVVGINSEARLICPTRTSGNVYPSAFKIIQKKGHIFIKENTDGKKCIKK